MKVYRLALIALKTAFIMFIVVPLNFSTETYLRWDDAYIEFVKSLKEFKSNESFRKQAYKGLKDGYIDDEKFIIESTSVLCRGLLPTQNEIDIDSSLKFPLVLLPEQFVDFVTNDTPVTVVDEIVVLNKTHVIDGHHRWAGLLLCNPDRLINIINCSNKLAQPQATLKALQAVIYSETNTIPADNVTGPNVYEITKEELYDWIFKYTNGKEHYQLFSKHPDLMEKLLNSSDRDYKKLHRDPSDKKAYKEFFTNILCDFIWKNIQILKNESAFDKDAPSRKYMPQSDDVNWVKPFESGQVDFMQPYGK
ncbi:hypothetical protein N9N03_01735 [Chlamydiia bacterium]|nr:hypothetical protein [Chlamydiia bacterium]